MTNRKRRWIVATGLAVVGSVGVGGVASTALADHRIKVLLDDISPTCTIDPAGDLIVGEAVGYDIFNNKQCEALSQGTSAVARCPPNAIKHQARVSGRQVGTYNETTILVSETVYTTTWTNMSGGVTYSSPVSPYCQQGGTLNVYSQGLETDAGVP